MSILFNAPAVAVLDQNYNLTVSWTPFGDSLTGSYSAYNHWDVYTTVNAGPIHTAASPAPVGYAGGSLTFTEILSAGVVTLTMRAFSSSDDSAPILPAWETSGTPAPRTFPTVVTSAVVLFSSTSLLLGQTLTVTLSATYAGADQWQVTWPDNTTTGWLPLASNVVTKSFSIPGVANIVIQTRRNYSAIQYAPPTTLISQITQQVFVIDQQAANTPTIQGGLTGNLGIGGQQGFEIVNATSGTVAPEPWEVIARALVRDTSNSELKLLIATSRFSNASSLLGTMALDVFPIEGRPRSKELIMPPYELAVTSTTESVPVKITTTALPALFVGKSVTEALGGPFQLLAQNGVAPYIWGSVGLPSGLTINVSGVLNGTPLELGQFEVTIAVQDSSTPFSIDEVTFLLTVETDLLVELAPNQVDVNHTPLAQKGTSLGAARVGTPYTVTMQVGNIDINAASSGGLPPYTWSAPAGAFPTGLSISTEPNSLFGLVSGTPSTYNSTTDFNTTYSVTVQVTDSIGAKATQTYTMALAPEALSFGHLNQTTLYADEKFKLVVPVFGGQSPYTLSAWLFDNNALYTNGAGGSPSLVDGQIEIPFLGTASTGTHTFALQVTDSLSAATNLVQFSFKVETEISDVRIVPGYLVNWSHPTDGSWALNDGSEAGQAVNVPFGVSGNFSGFALSGVRLNLTAAANAVGSPLTTMYTMPSNQNFANFVGQAFFVAGFANPANNGMFTCTASAPTTITVDNRIGVAQAATPYVLTLSHAANASGGTTIYTYTSATYGNGANNALAGLTFVVAGFTSGVNNGSFLCSASTAASLTLANAAGAFEAHAATATTPLAKALADARVGGVTVPTTPNGKTVDAFFNGIEMAADPTNLTVTATPDVEWASGGSASFGNAEKRVPLSLQQNFQLTSVDASIGSTAVYRGTITGGAGNAYATHTFIVTGFANPANNNGAVTPYDSSALGAAPLVCSASTATTLTLSNASAVLETNPAIAIDLASSEQVSRKYTTLTHGGAIPPGDIGAIITNTRPYIVGDVVGLNPRKPYFDSPDIPAFNGVNAWTAIVQGGSTLPPGLSLDANTGLVYGTLAGTAAQPSVIQYIDASGAVHGTVTVNWTTYKSDFLLTDNVVDSQIVGAAYNGATAFTAPPGVALQSAFLVYGVLPNGLSVSAVGANIIISGTPTEAGYFDCWFQAQTSSNQLAYAYHRISTTIPVQVLTIVGWADILSITGPVLGAVQSFPLPNAIVSANYVNPVTGNPVTLVAQYGDPPYTFSSAPSFPFHGIALSANDVPGVSTAGELSGGPVTSFSPTPFVFTVQDTNGPPGVTVTTTLSSQASALAIAPPVLPVVTAGLAYSPLVTLVGSGSVLTPFNFSPSPISANPLPVGMTLTNASPTTATIQGTTTQTGYGTKVVVIRLSDTSGAYVDVPYSVQVIAGLALKTGIDYVNSLSTGSLGYIDAGNVNSIVQRPNFSFFVVATGVVSASTAGIAVQTNNPNIAGTVQTLASGVAQIELSGAGFDVAPSASPYSVAVTVIDSGISITATFNWTVYNDGVLRLAATNAFPTQFVTG